MNTRTTIALVAFLTVSIFVGFVPLLLKSSQVEAHPGDYLITTTAMRGYLQCEVDGQTGSTETDLNFFVSGKSDGVISFGGETRISF